MLDRPATIHCNYILGTNLQLGQTSNYNYMLRYAYTLRVYTSFNALGTHHYINELSYPHSQTLIIMHIQGKSIAQSTHL